MAVPLVFQFAIALFTGMVAATFIPHVRKVIPRPVEVLLWFALIVVCAVGLLSINDADARRLTASVIWGTDRVINTIVALILSGIGAWIMDNRFAISTWLLVSAGVDVFALLLIRSVRAARPWRPRVRLREWVEIPMPAAPPAAVGKAPAPDPLAGFGRRVAAGSAVLGAVLLAKAIEASIWSRDVLAPVQQRRLAAAAQTGGVGSRARLESLRETAAQMQFAAKAWYAAAAEPMVAELAVKAQAAGKGLRPVAMHAAQVIDIQALMTAQSIGWYGVGGAGPATEPRRESGGDPPDKTDRMAS